MTTERGVVRCVADRGVTGRLARFAASAVLVVCAWFALLVGAARLLEPTDEVLAHVPADRIAAVLSSVPVRALDAPAGLLRLRGDAPGFVAALYAAGATWVIPASRGGCRRRPVEVVGRRV